MRRIAKNFNSKITRSILAGSMVMTALNASAQVPGGEQGVVFWFSIGVVVFLLFVVLFLLYFLSTFLKHMKQDRGEYIAKKSFWESKTVTAQGRELTEDELLSTHEYDGIRELDNNLPPWWVAMFYGTIVFGIIYLLNYHLLNTGDLQEKEYNIEMATAAEQKKKLEDAGLAGINENSVTLVKDKVQLEKGSTIFSQNCAACHGKSAEGGVGPNLTDEYWLHGGGIKNVFKTVKYGVPEKGMIPWQNQLKPEQIQEVASYILSLQGSNPANGKAPQGEVYKE